MRIEVAYMAQFESKLAKINRKARKLGLPRINVTYGERDRDSFGNWYVEVLTDIPEVKIAGWTCIAVIDPMPEVNLIRCFPGQECPEEYRTAKLHCEHCQKSRKRNNVFVLRHEDGTYKQVGRQCLQDFLGHSVESAVFYASVHSLCEGLGEGGGGERTWLAEEYLACVVNCVRKLGWVSKKEDPHFPTCRQAEILYSPVDKDQRDWIEAKELGASEEDKQTVVKALEWAKTLTGSEYYWNLRALSGTQFYQYKHLGLAASLIAAYRREMDKQAEQAAKPAEPVSQHVGTIGKREIFNVRCVFQRAFDSDFGTRYLVKFKDLSGNVLVWWSSNGGLSEDEEQAESLRIKATVKKHGEYNGKLQTDLSRVTLLS